MKITFGTLIKLGLLLVIILSLSACSKKPDNTPPERALTDTQNKVIAVLETMDAFISESNVADADLQDAPWIKDSMKSQAVDKQVSLHNAQDYINAYKFYTGDEKVLDAKQLVSLLDDPNASADPSFDRLDKWLGDNGQAKVSIYRNGVRAAYNAYEKSEQKKYSDMDLAALTANERLALAQWAMDNPDAGAFLNENEKKDYEFLRNIPK